jgi:hypothetical protein
MKIDRSNYEIWFIDWLDGNLNSLQTEELNLFLYENPDLKEEFNDLASVKNVAAGNSFAYKEKLKKSPSDIPPAQFEYLCTAYLENDLNESQQTELLEIVNRFPEKKKIFSLIQKTTLTPDRVSYKHKSLLLKRTAFQKALRLSVTGISAAAAIALVLIIFSVLSGPATLKVNTSAHNFLSDSTVQMPTAVISADRIIKESMTFIPPAPQGGYRKMTITSKSPLGDLRVNLTARAFKKTSTDDSLVRKTDSQKITVIKVPVSHHVDLGNENIGKSLVASNPPIIIPAVEDERSKAGKFISKTFREKLLKEKKPSDTPLKGYEIAEAGITGLNKLFGWQMVFDMKNDANGQPKSVYFSSKILTLNTPVKKREPQP